WNGRVFQVRLSKSARYKKDFTPPKVFESDPDTLALYDFRAGEGTTLADISGNGHDGTIHGAKWIALPTDATADPFAAISEHTSRIDFAAERKAAEWVRSMGGEISIAQDDKKIELKKGDKLPRGNFTLHRVRFDNVPVTDDAL